MRGTRAGIEVSSGPRVQIEMAVIVAAADQGRTHARVVDQPAVRRDVADTDADAALAVRLGSEQCTICV